MIDGNRLLITWMNGYLYVYLYGHTGRYVDLEICVQAGR